jgi:hypothetical protein
MNALLALAPVAAWGLVDWVICIIIVAAVIAVMYVALNQFGITIPPWAVRIFWILVVAVVAILAIRFLLSL